MSAKKRRIRIKLVGYADSICERRWTLDFLSRDYEVEVCDNPDYLFWGGFGFDHYEYDCVKIAIIGENLVPNFNAFDYAVGFDHLDFGDRYLRVPLFALYEEYGKLGARNRPTDEELLERGFCSFVVSNGTRGDPFRTEFFRRLSEYRPVASGGRYLNNVGGPVADKLAFCGRYKFNIAFENSSSPGYTTEKVMQPLTVNSVPIYWGNPRIDLDFRPECMVRVRDRDDIERAVEEIVYLDTHDDAYLAKCRAQCLVHDQMDWYDRKLMEFYHGIIDQPICRARRVNRYGYQNDLNGQMRHFVRVNKLMRKCKVYKCVDVVRATRRMIGL